MFSHFMKEVPRSIPNEWRVAALEALRENRRMWDIKTKRIVVPWRPGD